MESGWPVDLPHPRLHAELGRRRHRRLTLPSGLLLFVCLFVPAVNGCNDTVYPLEMPYFWHPYLYGGAVAVAALARTVRGVRLATTLLRLLAFTTLAGASLVSFLSVGLGVIELMLGFVLLAIIGTRGHSEKRLALTGIVMAVLSILWFGLWAGSAGALVGVYMSLGAAIFLLAGALFWLSEI